MNNENKDEIVSLKHSIINQALLFLFKLEIVLRNTYRDSSAKKILYKEKANIFFLELFDCIHNLPVLIYQIYNDELIEYVFKDNLRSLIALQDSYSLNKSDNLKFLAYFNNAHIENFITNKVFFLPYLETLIKDMQQLQKILYPSKDEIVTKEIKRKLAESKKQKNESAETKTHNIFKDA